MKDLVQKFADKKMVTIDHIYGISYAREILIAKKLRKPLTLAEIENRLFDIAQQNLAEEYEV